MNFEISDSGVSRLFLTFRAGETPNAEPPKTPSFGESCGEDRLTRRARSRQNTRYALADATQMTARCSFSARRTAESGTELSNVTNRPARFTARARR